jgi:hypothetical protein
VRAIQTNLNNACSAISSAVTASSNLSAGTTSLVTGSAVYNFVAGKISNAYKYIGNLSGSSVSAVLSDGKYYITIDGATTSHELENGDVFNTLSSFSIGSSSTMYQSGTNIAWNSTVNSFDPLSGANTLVFSLNSGAITQNTLDITYGGVTQTVSITNVPNAYNANYATSAGYSDYAKKLSSNGITYFTYSGISSALTSINSAISTESAARAGSKITIGSTDITLNGSTSVLTGLTSVSAITFIGSLSGNASSATKLATTRYIAVGSSNKSFDGTQNLAFSLDEIGAQAKGSYAPSVLNTYVSSDTINPATYCGIETYISATYAKSAVLAAEIQNRQGADSSMNSSITSLITSVAAQQTSIDALSANASVQQSAIASLISAITVYDYTR